MENNSRSLGVIGISKVSVFALILAFLAFTGSTALRADSTDTIDDVIRVGRSASAGLSEFETGLRQAQAITARLAQDRAFAASILDLAKKNDKQGIGSRLATINPGSRVTVNTIEDFSMDLTFCTNTRCYRLCVGDNCKHPSGAKSPVVFDEF